ncbi:MAG: M24 family metallopeptidase [Proteobacteria bacterium]|nr:M24 family metallopeptidase [Pseudomonadota bacterium]
MPTPLFSPPTYRRRLRAVQAEMQRRGVDILLVADPANMYYLSAYDGWSFYVPQCLIVLAKGEAPLWWGRGIDLAGARRTVWMEEDALFGYSDDYVHNPPHHPGEHLAQTLTDLSNGRGTVGYESETFYFTPALLHSVQANAPQLSWQDADGLVNWQRAVKEEEEIAHMRQAGRLVAAMHDTALAVAAVGVQKHKIAAAVYQTAIAGVPDIYGDYAAIVPMLPAGADAAAPHLTWDDTPLAENSGMFLELAGCYRRYHCPLARTIFCGTPPSKWRAAEAALIEGIAACMAAAKPQAVCGDVARALTRTLKKQGFDKQGRCGYSIGIGYPPDWGERTMSLRPQDETPLQAGMTFHLMPGLWLEDWGIEITESIVITKTGCEALANVERRLFVV